MNFLPLPKMIESLGEVGDITEGAKQKTHLLGNQIG